jgi:hypothetical protein
MTTDLDIYRTAKLCIDQHGNEATFHAGIRVDEMLDNGDLDGRAVWLRVLEAIKELVNTEPGGTMH